MVLLGEVEEEKGERERSRQIRHADYSTVTRQTEA